MLAGQGNAIHEINDHERGQTPDHVVAIVEAGHRDFMPQKFKLVGEYGLFGQEEIQRHPEDAFDFLRAGLQDDARRHLADDGLHAQAGARGKHIQLADHLHAGLGQADFLAALAQGGGDDGGVAVVAFAARKGDLAGMAGQVPGTPGQDQLRPGLVSHRHEHASIHSLGLGPVVAKIVFQLLQHVHLRSD